MSTNYNKYAQEGNAFLKKLANELDHPDEIARTGIVLTAVLHTLRDRITVAESLNLISQLPMFLKATYVNNWKYQEKVPHYHKAQDFTKMVEKYQAQFGETEFSWGKSTEEILGIIIRELGNYVSDGEFESVMAQLPEEIEEMFRESLQC